MPESQHSEGDRVVIGIYSMISYYTDVYQLYVNNYTQVMQSCMQIVDKSMIYNKMVRSKANKRRVANVLLRKKMPSKILPTNRILSPYHIGLGQIIEIFNPIYVFIFYAVSVCQHLNLSFPISRNNGRRCMFKVIFMICYFHHQVIGN